MGVGGAADPAGFALKQLLAGSLKRDGHEVVDSGARDEVEGDDCPDYVLRWARAVCAGEVERGSAVCGAALAEDLVAQLLAVRFSDDDRHRRRLDKVGAATGRDSRRPTS